MKPQHYRERQVTSGPWQIHLVSYQLGDLFYCKADNVSPGANIARGSAATQEEAERIVLNKAEERLARTRRQTV